jgi:hypothetical protein
MERRDKNEETGETDTMKHKITLYIGSDNRTQTVTPIMRKIIKDWADAYMSEGYTIIDGHGYWRGRREQTVILSTIIDDHIDAYEISALKDSLKQQAIMVTCENVDMWMA